MAFLLTFPALIAAHLGFAGFFGELIYQLRSSSTRVNTLSSLAFCGLVFLPANLALPGNLWLRLIQWAVTFWVVVVFGFRPAKLPKWLWTPSFAYRYLGGVMLLILAWCLGSGYSPSVVILGALAGFAGALAWRRGSNVERSNV